MITQQLMQQIRGQFRLDWHGIHGAGHWARVRHHGVALARAEGADERIPVLFSVIHDSQRWNDDRDPEHGARAADYASWLRERGLFELDDTAFQLLQQACREHSNGMTEADVSVRVCWDADRLDLGRVGFYPDFRRLCTATARQSEVIEDAWNWSIGRPRSTRGGTVTDVFVKDQRLVP